MTHALVALAVCFLAFWVVCVAFGAAGAQIGPVEATVVLVLSAGLGWYVGYGRT